MQGVQARLAPGMIELCERYELPDAAANRSNGGGSSVTRQSLELLLGQFFGEMKGIGKVGRN